jgi:hypothetical protein
MTAADLFGRIVSRLDAAGIPFMLTGSFAGAYHGRPRATQDIDFVIAPTAAQLHALVAQLPPAEYYVDTDAALDALRHESLFNVVDLETGWKVDFICRRSRPFSRAEFERRTRVELLGIALHIATAEDLLLAKLEWAKLGGSLRQIEDAAGLLQVSGAALDLSYIERWVGDLGLGDQWREALRAAGREPPE